MSEEESQRREADLKAKLTAGIVIGKVAESACAHSYYSVTTQVSWYRKQLNFGCYRFPLPPRL